MGYAIAGYVGALVGNQHARALTFGLEAGLVVGVVTAIANALMPLIEWTAEHMPAKRMGVIGVGLILIGFLLQSVQYWVTLLSTS
jgi:flagellar biosynthesis protein FliQ